MSSTSTVLAGSAVGRDVSLSADVVLLVPGALAVVFGIFLLFRQRRAVTEQTDSGQTHVKWWARAGFRNYVLAAGSFAVGAALAQAGSALVG